MTKASNPGRSDFGLTEVRPFIREESLWPPQDAMRLVPSRCKLLYALAVHKPAHIGEIIRLDMGFIGEGIKNR